MGPKKGQIYQFEIHFLCTRFILAEIECIKVSGCHTDGVLTGDVGCQRPKISPQFLPAMLPNKKMRKWANSSSSRNSKKETYNRNRMSGGDLVLTFDNWKKVRKQPQWNKLKRGKEKKKEKWSQPRWWVDQQPFLSLSLSASFFADIRLVLNEEIWI